MVAQKSFGRGEHQAVISRQVKETVEREEVRGSTLGKDDACSRAR